MTAASPSRMADLLNPLLLGSIGLLVLGVQPLLYGAFVHDGSIGEDGLGTLAAAEILALSIGSAAGIALLRRIRAVVIAGIGLILVAIANLLPLEAVGVFPVRILAGFGGGFAVAVAANAIALRSNVTAAAAGFLFLQATSQYAILQWYSIVDPGAHATTISLGLAVIALSGLLLLPFLTQQEYTAEEQKSAHPLPPLPGMLALLASALFVGATVGIWAYMGLWLEGRGIAADRVAPMLTASLFGQMIGALLAIFVGSRFQSVKQLFASAAAIAVTVLLLILNGAEGWLGWGLVIGFGLAWMIGTPALSGFVLDIDKTRRSLPFAASAQLLGAALLPTLAGELLASRSLDLVIWICLGSLCASLCMAVAASYAADRA